MEEGAELITHNLPKENCNMEWVNDILGFPESERYSPHF